MILNFPFRKKVSQLSYHLIELDIFSLRSFGFFIVPQMIIIQSPEELYGFVKNNIWAHQLYAFLSFPFHNGDGPPRTSAHGLLLLMGPIGFSLFGLLGIYRTSFVNDLNMFLNHSKYVDIAFFRSVITN